MQIRNAVDLGAAIRDRRRSLKLAQRQLAQRIGVTRQWIIDIEKGKPRAEIGLALRALDALGLHLTLADLKAFLQKPTTAGIDLGAIVNEARKPGIKLRAVASSRRKSK
jgi:HTH-type transcriptional regulator/antitoxin HipB